MCCSNTGVLYKKESQTKITFERIKIQINVSLESSSIDEESDKVFPLN